MKRLPRRSNPRSQGLKPERRAEQIVGRDRRERVTQLASCGEGCFDSRRRVNSDVMLLRGVCCNSILNCRKSSEPKMTFAYRFRAAEQLIQRERE